MKIVSFTSSTNLNLVKMSPKEYAPKNTSNKELHPVNLSQLPGYNIAFGAMIECPKLPKAHLPFKVKFTAPNGIEFRTITKLDGKDWDALHIPEKQFKILHLVEQDGKKMLGFSISDVNPLNIEGKSPLVATLPSLNETDFKNLQGLGNVQVFPETFTSTPGAIDEVFQYAIRTSNVQSTSKDMIYFDINELPSVVLSLQHIGCQPSAHLLTALRYVEPHMTSKQPAKHNHAVIEKLISVVNLDDIIDTFTSFEKRIRPKVVAGGDFLQAKQVDTALGTITYAHRPNSSSKGVVSINTIVKDKESGELYYVMLKENRPPIQAEIGDNSKVLACPAGLIDTSDAVLGGMGSIGDIGSCDNIKATINKYSSAGIRELGEETGLNAQKIWILGENIPSSPEYTSEDFASALAFAEIKKLPKSKIKNGVISMTPSNTDGGITDSILFIPLDKLDEVIKENNIFVNSQTMAGLELMKLKGMDKNWIIENCK